MLDMYFESGSILMTNPGMGVPGFVSNIWLKLDRVKTNLPSWTLLGLAVVFVIVIIVMIIQTIALINSERKSSGSSAKGRVPAIDEIGQIHNIGARNYQQDSLGMAPSADGILAIVADGMGGLEDGDKVSQKIVADMQSGAANLSLEACPNDNPLFPLVSFVNNDVNAFLGPDKLYKSGSTLLGVLVGKGGFHWVSVGDSRIYLYRAGALLQVNREHIHKRDLTIAAVNNIIPFDQININKQVGNVASFIGMGDLKYVDGSDRPVKTVAGDRLLIMSDGVFNALPEEEISRILNDNQDAKKAAAAIEKAVLAKALSYQDNFSCLVLNM